MKDYKSDLHLFTVLARSQTTIPPLCEQAFSNVVAKAPLKGNSPGPLINTVAEPAERILQGRCNHNGEV